MRRFSHHKINPAPSGRKRGQTRKEKDYAHPENNRSPEINRLNIFFPDISVIIQRNTPCLNLCTHDHSRTNKKEFFVNGIIGEYFQCGHVVIYFNKSGLFRIF